MLSAKPEVLSPAGSLESLVAAVRSGADAVYLGAREFSARRGAENFDSAALKEAVEYCHIRGVKVYLTLNTVVRQSELSDALAVAEDAYKSGIDGIIVQDLGLAGLIHRAMPELELHASTQMSLHSPAALKSLKKMGFCRVVAAREMSKRQLKDFCLEAEKLGLEVEVFVHGALCMSVSGQCLLSAVLGQRSGNRGLCAGPCRLPFAAENGTGYDLSLKDLSLLPHLKELSEMGVSSLKIEGRMKRPEYVAAATAAVRSAVDEGYVPNDLNAALKGVFSRSGFTDGYFENRLGRNMFGIRTKDDVAAAKDTFKKLHELYRAERQGVALSIGGEFIKSKPSKLTLICGQNTVTVLGDIPQTAETRAVTKGEIENALKKLGGTPYFCTNCNIACDEDIFILNSQLNSLRRSALEQLNALRSKADVRETVRPLISPAAARKTEPKLVGRFRGTEQIPEHAELAAVIFPFEQDIPAITGTHLIAELPRWISDEDKIIARLNELKDSGITTAYCGNLSAVAIAEKCGFSVVGDIGLNIYNTEALSAAKGLGLCAATLSAETTAKEAAGIEPLIPTGLFAYGRLPLMLLKNCPLKNGSSCKDCDKKGDLCDRMGKTFPVRCRGDYSELFNSTPVYLADRLRDISSVDYLLLSFTDETAEEVEKIIKAYREGADPPTDFTRGLAFRPSL